MAQCFRGCPILILKLIYSLQITVNIFGLIAFTYTYMYILRAPPVLFHTPTHAFHISI